MFIPRVWIQIIFEISQVVAEKMTCLKTGTWDWDCWIPGTGFPTHHFLGTVNTVDISKKCYIQTHNTIQQWTEKYWECWMTVFIQKYIKNLECIEILYMVQVYILLNILSSNITYGTGTKFSLKLLQLVKKFSSQKKKLFGWWKSKVQVPVYHCNTVPR